MPWRIMAGCLALLVIALGLAQVSPEAHALAHGHNDHAHAGCDHGNVADKPVGDEDHRCAVELFGQGTELPVTPSIVPSLRSWHETSFPAPTELYLSAPRYLRQPERGPPWV
jgi:hypothetical protein